MGVAPNDPTLLNFYYFFNPGGKITSGSPTIISSFTDDRNDEHMVVLLESQDESTAFPNF